MKSTRLGRKIGYARVSTDEQNLDLQIQALKSAGCDVIYTDSGISGSIRIRPGLTKALKSLHRGDKLVVWRLDRLGRSLVNLVHLLEELGQREIRFRSMCEHIDTSSSGGRLVFHMMAALAEFERSLISERTRAGMAAARARGQHVGRLPSLNYEQCLEARALMDQGLTAICVANRFGVTPRTLIRLLRRTGSPSGTPTPSGENPANECAEIASHQLLDNFAAMTPDPPKRICVQDASGVDRSFARNRENPAQADQASVSGYLPVGEPSDDSHPLNLETTMLPTLPKRSGLRSRQDPMPYNPSTEDTVNGDLDPSHPLGDALNTHQTGALLKPRPDFGAIPQAIPAQCIRNRLLVENDLHFEQVPPSRWTDQASATPRE